MDVYVGIVVKIVGGVFKFYEIGLCYNYILMGIRYLDEYCSVLVGYDFCDV